MTPNASVKTYQCVRCDDHYPAEAVRFSGVHSWTQAMVHIGGEAYMCGSCLAKLAIDWLNDQRE